MPNFDEELRKIFGDKYEGCTQRGDELVEYRLKPGYSATAEELAMVDALPKSEIAELRDKVKNLTARLDKLEARLNTFIGRT